MATVYFCGEHKRDSQKTLVFGKTRSHNSYHSCRDYSAAKLDAVEHRRHSIYRAPVLRPLARLPSPAGPLS